MRKISLVVASVGLMFLNSTLFSAESILITPSAFDFGWCPDNAKISAEFTIRNTGVDAIPLTSVQPTCGCTASQFTPGTLASNDEKKVGLTFNTRGYAGSGFNKSAKIKTESSNDDHTVYLRGFVVDPLAKVIPDQDGIAGFEPNQKEKEKVINIQNKGDKDVTLEVVQAPASWAKAKLETANVKAGASVKLEISVDGSLADERTTSITLAANDGSTTPSRLTVAIRTGPPPAPIRKPQPAPPAPAPAPTK